MKSIHQVGMVSLGAFISASIALAQQVEQAAPGTPSMSGGSPMTDFVAGAVIQVFLVAVLVVALVGGGLLVLNLGLLSKRSTDHTGEINPSDVGFLKNERFPEEAYEEQTLPAQAEINEVDPEEDPVVVVAKTRGPTRAA